MLDSETPRRCWAEVDLGALVHNALVAREAAGGADVMAVVKSDAYGHGMVAVAAGLDPHVDAFGVACVAEGMRLRSAGCGKPILVLGAVAPDHFRPALENGLELSLSTLDEADALDQLGAEMGQVAPVHVVFDTGMGRIGIVADAGESLDRIAAKANLEIVGLASHLPSADEDEVFTRAQIGGFSELVAAVGLAPRWVHIANSAGALAFPRDGTNLVRAGLMLYGTSPLPEHQARLRPALAWKSRLMLVRDLPPGHSISYGRTFTTLREPFTRVATVGVGYGDGYLRSLSGSGAEVLVGGRRCPVLGRVTMDQIMVDVTDLGDAAKPGDEVVLIGTQGGERIPATELAERAGTIAWEIFTGITQRVQREYAY